MGSSAFMMKRKKLFLALLSGTLAVLTACAPTNKPSEGSTPGSSIPGTSEKPGDDDDKPDPKPDEPSGTIVEKEVMPTGTETGDLSAKGKFYTDYATFADEQQAAKKVAVQIAEEGDVLLKNANALPLNSSEINVTLFGMHSVNLITAGGGSGAGKLDNNGIKHSTLESSLTDAGFNVNPSTISLYNSYQTLGTISNELPIDNYTPSTISSYYAYSNAAIITFSREGTENKDLQTNTVVDHANEDDHILQLDDNEVALVKHVKKHFNKVIVLINSSNIMQIPELAESKTEDNLGVDAILWIGGVGNNGVDAVGKILNGKVNPSGHTSDLWSRDFKKDPSWTNFGFDTQNKDADGTRMDASYYDKNGKQTNYSQTEYREGIYNGYRYYETLANDKGSAGEEWYKENVLYPFGYGLSYTTFEWKWDGVDDNVVIDKSNKTVTMRVKVTNTGSVAGKDVVQIYYSAPYTKGGIEKSSNNLAGYAKTKLLNPGDSQTVEVQFVAQDMASFDWNDANKNNFKGYELEKGNYTITANRDSHTPVLSVTRKINEDILCKTDYKTGKDITPIFTGEFDSTNATLLKNSISRGNGLEQPKPSSKADRTLDDETLKEYDDQDIYNHNENKSSDPWNVNSIPSTWKQNDASANLKIADMSGVNYEDMKLKDGSIVSGDDEGSKKWESFMNQLSWDDMCNIVSGDAKSGPGISAMPNIGKVEDNYKDGPVQIGGGTLFPSNPILAASFNTDLAEQKGRLVGNEGIFLGLSQWAGPAMNTHRSPFSGRNFEYYSEDGVHAAGMAAAEVRGAVSKGLVTYAKHFFLNDQESYRADFGGVFTWATEQAMREIYLKPFEAAIKAGSMGMMSSFNRIGKQVTATSYAVHQYLLRDEWDSKADVCTDAWAKAYVPVNKMAVAGSDQLLGSSKSYSANALDWGTWDASKNIVMVKGTNESTTDDTASPTLYFGMRSRAQRALYARANSTTAQNGITAGEKISVILEKGVANNAAVKVSSTNDIKVSLKDGEKLPEGVSLVNSNVLSGTPTTEGNYKVKVNVTLDGWVSSEAELDISVRSAMTFNDVNIETGKTVAEIEANKVYEASINTPSLAYRNQITDAKTNRNLLIVNYYEKDFQKYNRDEDKTASDIITIPADEADTAHEYGYSVEGNLPDGLTATPVMKTVKGLSNRGSYEAVDYLKLTGTPTKAGTYTFTVKLNYPTVMYMSGWLFPSFLSSDNVYTQTITIVVK